MGYVNVYKPTTRQVKEQKTWRSRLNIAQAFAMLTPSLALVVLGAASTGWVSGVLFLAGLALTVFSFYRVISYGVDMDIYWSDGEVRPIQRKYLARKGWKIADPDRYAEYRAVEAVYEIGQIKDEFPGIDTLSRLYATACGVLDAYLVSEGSVATYSSIVATSDAKNAQIAYAQAKDNSEQLHKSLYSLNAKASAIRAAENMARAADRTRVLESSLTGPGDVSDVTSAAKVEADLADEYIRNRQV